jgi:methanethiol S-methyltransferase
MSNCIANAAVQLPTIQPQLSGPVPAPWFILGEAIGALLMAKFIQLIYAAVAYFMFLAAFLYAIGFVGDLAVPKTIDAGPTGPIVVSLALDALLLGVFAMQHSIMARPAFKRWWTRFVPPASERSTYVVASSLALALLYWQWRPIGGTVWALDHAAAQVVLCVYFAGWVMVVASTFMLSHFELFGLSQAYAAFRDRAAPAIQFRAPLLYGFVRHPIMLGFIIAFWAAPVMSVGRLVFAVSTTLYILVALQFEEADLIASLGATYADYRARVPMLVPFARLGAQPRDKGAPPKSIMN